MSAFRDRYGASPLHLLLVLASFALTLYAGVRLLRGDTVGVLIWFVGAALIHDLLLLPAYSVTDRAARRLCRRVPKDGGSDAPVRRGPSVNYLRVPAFLSGLLLLVWWPLILRRVPHYTAVTGLPADVFLGRWLLITAGLFAVSALCLLLRMRRSVRPVRPE
ncbi:MULTISPECIES: hypothetical protein [Streptomyces]|uniref:Uncharacterized protein n=1 Tax=Streptomyces tsukubensis (strain DSM 42081 / NBRC 108919 / NRRL 18488 / 9993) TaxID=1114943 RepID=I2N931_STRT9|nr:MULTISPECIES: hypothetical protein [Streptomyces]AZK97387.1 hypothetical protein B7R87_28510 [Streptomyces tsukubensis]EIF93528.1 lipoprotein [Streptomyces tsukubensis NRRL18488]MYS65226.1 hypothetical protein [Streptomyces sp. SID5473]QKM66658.1 hypothetical protein STSU_005270 [Streptomyces tsukubensis NRRL18488]TAI44996.1 hypothetical protein EWI31_06955 [Streptomyces tsukubensis]